MNGHFLWFYFSLKGRTGRRPYWLYFYIPIMILGLPVILYAISRSRQSTGLPPLILASITLMVWVTVAVYVKRLHDIGVSGWWVIVGLLPIVNYVTPFALGCWPGQQGDNRYGPDPQGSSLTTL